MAVGVGMAVAKAERERRSVRAQRARERQFALLPGEPLRDGIRRMALAQLDLTIELLEGVPGMRGEQVVHDTRKALKRLRALVRLLEDELGEQAVARERAVLREAGLRLAQARDAEVRVKTLDELMGAHPGKLARKRGVMKLRAGLVAERERAAEGALGDLQARAQVLADLRAARVRVAAWSLSHSEGIEAVEPAIRRLYKQGRRRRKRAARTPGDPGRAMHRWRKRVKDLRYAAEIVDRRDPDEDGARGGHSKRHLGPGKRARRRAGAGKREDEDYIRRVAHRADELAEVLGHEHDLVMLATWVRAKGQDPGSKRSQRRTKKVLLKLIARRRRRLRRDAMRAGKRLYRKRPKEFARRVRRAHAGAGAVS